MSLNDNPLGGMNASDDHAGTTDVVAPCACNRDLTLNELMAAYPDRKKAVVEKFLPELNATMQKYDITSCIRKVHFLAQVGHESSELQYVAEVLPKGMTEEKRYPPLGYKGRGLIQLTGPENYTAYGNAVSQDFMNGHKVKLEETKWATDSAGWFWGKNDLNSFADRNDMIYITALINGAFNGYEGERTSRLRLLKNTVNALHIRACNQLEALFSAFPEMDKFTYDSYSFEASKAYDNKKKTFGWGYWHDPKSKMKGTKKDSVQAKLGYMRYIELLGQEVQHKSKKKMFGFLANEALEFAQKRVRELS